MNKQMHLTTLFSLTLLATITSITPLSASAADPATAPAVQTAFPAVSYHNSNCTRCHGAEGMFHGNKLAQYLAANNLRTKTALMAAGPAQAPLTDPKLDTLVAYLASLAKKKPFVAVTAVTASGTQTTLEGEITDDTTLKATIAGKEMDVTVDGSTWKLTLPTADLGTLTLTAQRGDEKATLTPTTAACTTP